MTALPAPCHLCIQIFTLCLAHSGAETAFAAEDETMPAAGASGEHANTERNNKINALFVVGPQSGNVYMQRAGISA